jgi:hypothetical protein
MTYRDRMIERAMEVASSSKHPKWQLGAVIFKGRTELASSPNIVRKTPWLDSGKNATFHAEVSAVKRLGHAKESLLRDSRSLWLAFLGLKSLGSLVPVMSAGGF